MVNHANLAPAELASLEAAVARLRTLEEVIHWGLAQRPERMIVEVVVQDEYCHDVVIDGPDDHHVVFDTT